MKTSNCKPLSINSEKGVALIIALGILAILAILGTSFAINMRLEQKASANYRDMVKAIYIAEAGIERGIAELLSTSDIYIKNNFDTLTHTWASTITITTNNFVLGKGEAGECTIEIKDASAMICINDDQNPNLAVMLKNLGIAINACDGYTNNNDNIDRPLPSGFASDIVDYRNNTLDRDYRTKEEVKIVPGDTNETYNTDIIYAGTDKEKGFKDFITTRAEVNPDVNRAPININTAEPEVLMAIIGGVTGLSPTHTECIATVETILSYRSNRDYDFAYTGGEPWKWEIGDDIVTNGKSNPFDGFDSNRGDALDPDISGFSADGLDNDGDGINNLEDCYLFAGGARGEFEALVNLLADTVNGPYYDEGLISQSTADAILQNADSLSAATSTEFSFRTKNFEIISTGRLFRQGKKVAEKKMVKIIQR